MLALAEDFQAVQIEPDYRADPVELYIKVARGLLKKKRNLDLLSVQSSRSSDSKTKTSLPSWVPDWSTPDTVNLSNTVPTHYSASADTSFDFALNDADPTGTMLTLSGYYFDRIAEIGLRPADMVGSLADLIRISPPYATVLMTLELWVNQMVGWEFTCPQYSKPGTYLTGEDMIDVYWALIIAARNQFETRWYVKDRVNNDIRPGWWSQWCAQQLDKCWRFRNKHFRWLYYGVILSSIISRGLLRFGHYDEEIIRSRTIIRTEQGYIGLVSASARPGDSIAICRGGRVPLVIRLDCDSRVTTASPSLRLVSDAYLHGIMHGEAWDGERCHSIGLA